MRMKEPRRPGKGNEEEALLGQGGRQHVVNFSHTSSEEMGAASNPEPGLEERDRLGRDAIESLAQELDKAATTMREFAKNDCDEELLKELNDEQLLRLLEEAYHSKKLDEKNKGTIFKEILQDVHVSINKGSEASGGHKRRLSRKSVYESPCYGQQHLQEQQQQPLVPGAGGCQHHDRDGLGHAFVDRDDKDSDDSGSAKTELEDMEMDERHISSVSSSSASDNEDGTSLPHFQARSHLKTAKAINDSGEGCKGAKAAASGYQGNRPLSIYRHNPAFHSHYVSVGNMGEESGSGATSGSPGTGGPSYHGQHRHHYHPHSHNHSHSHHHHLQARRDHSGKRSGSPCIPSPFSTMSSSCQREAASEASGGGQNLPGQAKTLRRKKKQQAVKATLIKVEELDGYRGADDLESILEFIEAGPSSEAAGTRGGPSATKALATKPGGSKAKKQPRKRSQTPKKDTLASVPTTAPASATAPEATEAEATKVTGVALKTLSTSSSKVSNNNSNSSSKATKKPSSHHQKASRPRSQTPPAQVGRKSPENGADDHDEVVRKGPPAAAVTSEEELKADDAEGVEEVEDEEQDEDEDGRPFVTIRRSGHHHHQNRNKKPAATGDRGSGAAVVCRSYSAKVQNSRREFQRPTTHHHKFPVEATVVHGGDRTRPVVPVASRVTLNLECTKDFPAIGGESRQWVQPGPTSGGVGGHPGGGHLPEVQQPSSWPSLAPSTQSVGQGRLQGPPGLVPGEDQPPPTPPGRPDEAPPDSSGGDDHGEESKEDDNIDEDLVEESEVEGEAETASCRSSSPPCHCVQSTASIGFRTNEPDSDDDHGQDGDQVDQSHLLEEEEEVVVVDLEDDCPGAKFNYESILKFIKKEWKIVTMEISNGANNVQSKVVYYKA